MAKCRLCDAQALPGGDLCFTCAPSYPPGHWDALAWASRLALDALQSVQLADMRAALGPLIEQLREALAHRPELVHVRASEAAPTSCGLYAHAREWPANEGWTFPICVSDLPVSRLCERCEQARQAVPQYIEPAGKRRH